MQEYSIDDLLAIIVQQNASDLHLRVGLPPKMRVHGHMQTIEGYPVITNKEMQRLLFGMVTEEQKKAFVRERDFDFAYAIKGLARFRCNFMVDMGRPSAVFRQIPEHIPAFTEIGLPEHLRQLCYLQRGLVLVTGPTGSGKSTSLAAMLRVINETRDDNIITIEDPVEFVHEPIRCVVRQREVGKDTSTFARALRAALRQDPDVILVGEMRDLETIETAITAAETGHLVFGTLHTQSAPTTIDRIIDVFPGDQQAQIRAQLASTLQAIITQTLLPRADGRGRVPAHEILMVNAAVRNMIRESKLEQVRSIMQTNSALGMQTMDRALADLVLRGVVDHQVARDRAQENDEFDRLLRGGGDGDKKGGARSVGQVHGQKMGE